MNVVTYTAFKNELEKISAFIGPAADLAGLGMLAVPGIKTLRDKGATAKEKNHAKWESAGLGTLAGGVAINDRHEIAEGAKNFMASKGAGNKLRSAWNIAKGGVGKVAPKIVHASADPGLTDGALSLFKSADIDKEALSLFGIGAKEVNKVRQPLQMAFKGHAKALRTGVSTSRAGVETARSFNPLTQTVSQQKSISIPGLR